MLNGTTAIWVRDRLGGLWHDEDFAGWYPRDGRPGLSPARLATVCVLQFLLGLSGRQAAEAVRWRIDFTYVLACLKEAGLVRERTTQRTDSAPVLAAVRDLTRLEPAPSAPPPVKAPAPWASPRENSRPATTRPHRATDTRVEAPLRGPLRSGGHVNEFAHGHGMRRVPLPRTGKRPTSSTS
ncbi:transposase [Streptomyces sp. B8F3]|uniref:transposase n=1 Tax=unclassified Streptomyces TaxID=2593676 RepID=UPI00325C4C45